MTLSTTNTACKINETYNTVKMLADGAEMYRRDGVPVIFLSQLKVGFAEYNIETHKMEVLGCTPEERKLVHTYRN